MTDWLKRHEEEYKKAEFWLYDLDNKEPVLEDGNDLREIANGEWGDRCVVEFAVSAVNISPVSIAAMRLAEALLVWNTAPGLTTDSDEYRALDEARDAYQAAKREAGIEG